VENAREEIHYQSNNITYVRDNQTSSPKFRWMDGVFLSALKAGDWVLLDEMNLASQSVLEGLNSVLDHRRKIFIPELNETFYCPPSFRIFACQVRSYFHLPCN
jgi:midasin (ATPase involved in ribosome maturation)